MDYEFKHFTNKREQIKFIDSNLSHIRDMFIDCYSPQDEKISMRSKENSEFFESSIISGKMLKWFFVLNESKIIAVCRIGNSEEVIKIDSKIRAYCPFNPKKSNFNKRHIRIGPVIDSLCKLQGYEKAGEFLLKNVYSYLKSLGKSTRLYLIPESMRSKSMVGVINNKNCNLRKEYYESNKKLVRFYKKMGYQELENTYFFDRCDWNTDEYIAYKIMYRDL